MGEPAVVEVRGSRGKGVLLVVGMVVFTVIGVAMILSGDIVTVIIGVLAVLLFGGLGILTAPKILRAGPLFTVDAAGLHLAEGGFLPWAQIEAVEGYQVASSVRCLGVRIRDLERYAASLTEQQRRHLLRHAWGVRDVRGSSVSDVVTYYAWQRRRGGWDMAWTQDLMDHRVDDVVVHCERLRGTAT